MKKFCYCKNWHIRNNSANVASILNPAPNCFKSPHAKHSNTCYCQTTNIPPQLFLQPRECVLCDAEYEYNNKNGFPLYHTPILNFHEINPRSRGNTHTNYKNGAASNVSTIKATEYIDDVQRHTKDYLKFLTTARGESNFSNLTKNVLKNRLNANTNEISNVNNSSPTDYRLNRSTSNNNHLPSFTNVNENVSNSKLQELNEISPQKSFLNGSTNLQSQKIEVDPTESSNYGSFRDSVDKTFLSSNYSEETSNTDNGVIREKIKKRPILENFKSVTKPSKGQLEEEDNDKNRLKRLSDFRMDHYFETHSTDDLIKTIPPHQCIHKFSLDKRLFPVPLNADMYESSRCIICNKPMKYSHTTTYDERYENKAKNIFPKYYKYGLAPKKIYIGNGSSFVIEMGVNCKNKIYQKNSTDNFTFADNYALNYQKLAT